MLRALLVKDFRIQKPVLILGFALLAAPILAVAIGGLFEMAWNVRNVGSDPWHSVGLKDGAENLVFGTVMAMLAVPAAGATAGARERRERSGDLLFTLPVPKWMIVVSRGAVSFVCAATPCVVGVGLAYLLVQLTGSRSRPSDSSGYMPLVVGGLTLFSSAWFGGSIFRSDVAGTAFGVVITGITGFGVNDVIERLVQGGMSGVQNEDQSYLFSMAMGCVAAVFGVAGTVVMLRRRTP